MPQPGMEARLTQLLQTWVAAVVGRKREISTLPLFFFFFQEQQSGEAWAGMAQGRYGSEILFPHVSVRSLLGAGALYHFHQ